MIRNSIIAVFVFLAGIFSSFLSDNIHASIFEKGDRIYISNLHQIDEDLYAFGENIIIEGHIDGDLVAGGYKTVINGDITGSVVVAGFSLQHKGRIERTLRAFVNMGSIDGYIGRAAVIFGNEIDIGRGAVIEQDLDAFGAIITVSGTVRGARSLIKGEKIIIEGTFEGDLDLEGKKITIGPSAVIMGNLNYAISDESNIEIDSGATIMGETEWTPLTEEDEAFEETSVTSIVVAISKLLAAFLFGIIFLALCRRYTIEAVTELRQHFTVSLATGILMVLVIAFAALMLVLSVALIITGLIISSGENAVAGALVLIFSIVMFPISSFATVSGGILFYTGKIIVGFLLGFLLFRLFKKTPAELGRFQLLVGLIILFLLFAIPYLGLLIYVVVSIAGAGAIILGIRQCRKNVQSVVQSESEGI